MKFLILITGIVLLMSNGLGCDSESTLSDSVDTDIAPVMQGLVSFRQATTGKTSGYSYKYYFYPDEHQGVLIIDAKASGTESFSFYPEIGQEFISNINVCWFGELGSLLCVESDRGAVCHGIRIYGLSRDGHVISVFDSAWRFGCRILDITGDGIPEIIGVNGDIGADKYEACIYQYNDGHFQLVETVNVKTPHFYGIVMTPPSQREPSDTSK